MQQNGGTALQDGAGGAGAALNGFRVFDNGVAAVIIGTAISAGKIMLTCSAPLSRAGPITVDHEFGTNPHGTATATPPDVPTLANYVFDNQTPQGDSIGFPLQPTNGSLTATFAGGGLLAFMRRRPRR